MCSHVVDLLASADQCFTVRQVHDFLGNFRWDICALLADGVLCQHSHHSAKTGKKVKKLCPMFFFPWQVVIIDAWVFCFREDENMLTLELFQQFIVADAAIGEA